jgi:ankyrin repeat protein
MEIFEAAKAGKVSDVERLLDAFWPPEVKKRYELTALEVAVQHGQFRVMRQLLDRMRQENDVAGLREGVALHLAAKHGHKNVANYLRICGADLHSTALGGRTPLMWASSEGHLECGSEAALLRGGRGYRCDRTGL